MARRRGIVTPGGPMLLAAAGLTAAAWQAVHRSSPLVRRWEPSAFRRRVAGPLSVLDSGPSGRPGDEVLVLLHGLGAAGDYFGAFYDGLSDQRRVLIFDVLGFGHSLDEERDSFGVEDHVGALDQALDSLGLGSSEVVLAAHSLSSAIALSWADQNSERTKHVYLWGAPIYRGATAAESVGKEYGPMGRLFVLDTKWAERACRFNCANRALSGRLMAMMAPRWPTQVSSDAALHTWAAYHQSLRGLILDFAWTRVLPASCPVTFFHGVDDPLGDQDYIRELAGRAEIIDVANADHHIALQRPDLLARAFDSLER